MHPRSAAPAMSSAQSLHRRAHVRRTSLAWATAQTCLRGHVARPHELNRARGHSPQQTAVRVHPPPALVSRAPREQGMQAPSASHICTPGSVKTQRRAHGSMRRPEHARAAPRRRGVPCWGHPAKASCHTERGGLPAQALHRRALDRAEGARMRACMRRLWTLRHAHAHPCFNVIDNKRQGGTARKPVQQRQDIHACAGPCTSAGCTPPPQRLAAAADTRPGAGRGARPAR